MSMDDLLMNVILAGVAGYVLKMWLDDVRRQGQPPVEAEGKGPPPPLPGATLAGTGLVVASALIGLGLCLAATGVEAATGWLADQREIAASFLLAMLGAAVIEELIFRGYLVVTRKGTAVMIAAVIGASLLFALAHPYLWSVERTGEGWSPAAWTWAWSLCPADFFFTGTIFVNSLVFYSLRLGPWNPSRSLLPCMVAHAAYNIGVFAVKLACGKVFLG